MLVKMLGIPTSDGTDIRGCELAPSRLREKGIRRLIEKYFPVYDLGDILIDTPVSNHMQECPCHDSASPRLKSENLHDQIFNYNRVIDFCRLLAQKAFEMSNEEDFSFFLGGDHSASIGSISGILKNYPDTAVIWVDAHADLNTPQTSMSCKAHGMSGSFLIRECSDSFLNQYDSLKPENLILLGQRLSAVDPGEKNLIGNKNIILYTWQDLKNIGPHEVYNSLLTYLNKRNINRIHLSFDVDFLSKEFVPGTGTPVPNGATPSEAKTLLGFIAKSGLLKSMDFMELNPSLDKDDITTNLSLELIEEVFKNLKH